MELSQIIRVNPFECNVTFHIETNHLIYGENQLTGFYMEYNTGLKWVKQQYRFTSEIPGTGNCRKLETYSCALILTCFLDVAAPRRSLLRFAYL